MHHIYYTVEELRELGCPDCLIIQYITFTKKEIDRMINVIDNTLNSK